MKTKISRTYLLMDKGRIIFLMNSIKLVARYEKRHLDEDDKIILNQLKSALQRLKKYQKMTR